MATLTSLAVTILLAITIDTCFAIKCLECSDTPNPGVCGTVASCYGNDTSCFVRQYITTSGAVLHETGCKSNTACNAKKRHLATDDAEDAVHDVDVCLECCDSKDFCNLNGCGNKIVDVSQRGLYCYECSVENDVYGCRTVRQCDPGFMCSIKKASFPGYYQAGCVPSNECNANDVPSLIGRRSQTYKAAVHLPYCCNDDFCNDILRFIVDSTADVDGGWSHWNAWSGCAQTCGKAVKTRTRSCDNPLPQNNGSVCMGHGTMTVSCLLPACPVDGGWSDWNSWSFCSKTCGNGGQHSRVRSCNNPLPQNGGQICVGNTVQTESCFADHCPVNGAWSDWGQWGNCSKTCGNDGYLERVRSCNNPTPQYQGYNCPGASKDTKPCTLDPCPVNGAWSDWGHWGSCSKSCGTDIKQYRMRTCNNPAPQYNGHQCLGHSVDINHCTVSPCPVDGAWSSWDDWSTCPHTCGFGGTQHRERKCNNPHPEHNGADCQGSSSSTKICGLTQCPVDGGWSDWSSWSTQGHSKTRHRSCNNPTPQHNGTDCHGHSSQTMSLADRCKQAVGFEFVEEPGVQLCLRHSTYTYSWPVSRDRCKHVGGHLVVIPNQAVDHAVLNFLKHKNLAEHTHGEATYAWIGLYASHETWHWADSHEHFNYNRFDGPSEHHHTPNHCVCGNGEYQEHWWSVNCDSTQYHYICEIDISD